MKLATALGKTTKFIKFTKTKLEDIRDIILTLCDSTFREIPATSEKEVFYEEWSMSGYKEEVKK